MKNEILEQPQVKGKWVVITTKFNCQSYPLNDKAIFVSDEDLEAIANGTKCFDLENNCVVDYDNSQDILKQEKLERISELKSLLSATDYKAIKYAEGLLSEEEYSPIKSQRQAYRDEINELERAIYELD